MRRSFPLHDLDDSEFEELVRHICREILGTGVIAFAEGKDGGRDATFEGTAQNFPSKKTPLKGKFVIQAKHTSNPVASCSDKGFSKILKKEEPKLKSLVKDKQIDIYIVFTNRKKQATKAIALERELKKLKIKTVHILGKEQIREWLSAYPDIWKSLGFDRFEKRFTIQATDLTEVITAFHSSLKAKTVKTEDLPHFPYAPKPRKNKINSLSKTYFEHMQADSLPHFSAIDNFLKNPRNESYQALYIDTADEIKRKIITHSSQFGSFDEALTYVADLVADRNVQLKGKRKFIAIFLHYMYYTCDIGQHASPHKTS